MKKILIIFIVLLPYAVISQIKNSERFNVITNKKEVLILEKVFVFKESKNKFKHDY